MVTETYGKIKFMVADRVLFVRDVGRVPGYQCGVGHWRELSTGQGGLRRRAFGAGRGPRRIAPRASGKSRYSTRPMMS